MHMQLPIFFFSTDVAIDNYHFYFRAAIIFALVIATFVFCFKIKNTRPVLTAISISATLAVSMSIFSPTYFTRTRINAGLTLIEKNHYMIDENTLKNPNGRDPFSETLTTEILDKSKKSIHVYPVTDAANKNLQRLDEMELLTRNSFWLKPVRPKDANGNPYQYGGYDIITCPVQVLAWNVTRSHVWTFVEAKCQDKEPTVSDEKLIYKVDMTSFLYHLGATYRKDMALNEKLRVNHAAHQKAYRAVQQEFENVMKVGDE